MYDEPLRLAQGVDALIAPLADRNTADAVEYLNTLDRDDAAHVLAALPQPRAVKLLEQPELHDASALVAQLPAEQRALLLLVSVEGFSYRDAATALDLPIGTVMSRLSRAREKLRQLGEGRSGNPALRVLK
jgi:DNA-directed RNA polymerase specialized sigma24 family protein